MSYTPTTWAAGDTVTAAKLNKLEQGVASSGGVLVVELDNDGNLDITAGDLFSAAQSGYVVVKVASEQLGNLVLPVVAATNNDSGYYFAVGFCDGNTFSTWLYHAALSTQKPSYYEP